MSRAGILFACISLFALNSDNNIDWPGILYYLCAGPIGLKLNATCEHHEACKGVLRHIMGSVCYLLFAYYLAMETEAKHSAKTSVTFQHNLRR
jgi:hypothetical protein